MKSRNSLEAITTVWPEISNTLSMPKNKKEYDNLVKILDDLIDKIGSSEKHPLASLMDTIGILIEKYEEKHIPEPEGTGINALKYLMKEHRLKQTDLNEIGSQGVVSEILNGKRELNARQIKALAERFSVSSDVFI